MSAYRITITLLLATVPAVASSVRADEPAEEFFETHVRPLLLRRCSECHGANKQQGGVRLDIRGGIHGNKEFEPLVVPGKPQESRLIQVVGYSGDDVQMPPKGKLPEPETEILTKWVQQGAYWPADGPKVKGNEIGVARLKDGSVDFQEARSRHWAFQPLTEPPDVPATSSFAVSPIDRFLQHRLEERGLALSEAADRQTLIRRATLDLWGLPPTWEQVQRFLNDDRPDAWPRLVDRLLASPLYGQRWGRHWLDVARYADTKGYVFQENPRYPFSYTYRDYVVDALNADKPYDRFVVEQLAADQLNLPEGDPALAAMGFVTVGPRYLNREPDIIDDRIDLIGRGLMGLTLGCSRCHDHKYDPVPIEDYYSLYGVFASCLEPDSLPLAGPIDPTPGYEAYLAERRKRQQAVEDFVSKTRAELLDQLRSRAGDYLLAVLRKAGADVPGDAAYEHGPPRDKLVNVWQTWLLQKGRDQHPVFRLLYELYRVPTDRFAAEAASRIEQYASLPAEKRNVNARLLTALQTPPPQSPSQLARRYGELLQKVDAEWKAMQASQGDAAPQELPNAADEEIRRVLYGSGSVADIPPGQESRLFERDHRDQLRKLERKVAEWQVNSPDAPPRAMVLNDKPQPVEPVVFLRGNVARRGDRVPRQPPRILTGGESRPFQRGSGRLELAEAIASPENPLTARVIVNRVWAWHFGQALVPTQSDFGLRGDSPMHPELLDWLAWHFMHTDEWSLKALHRRIILSRAYRQSSRPNSHAQAVDPQNALYWRFPRRRLEFEPMRDSLLAVAGRLDPALGGRPVDITGPTSGRRSIYAHIDRNNFSSLLRTFDYPSPDATSPGRPRTTVPQQALYGLNSPFLREMAEHLARAASEVPVESTEDRRTPITALYRRVFARDPTERELNLAVRLLREHPDGLPLVAHSLLLANEFLFVD